MQPGLDDVVAAETVLSHVDGELGQLLIKGFDVEYLAEHFSYEEAVTLLWSGFCAVDDFQQLLGDARSSAFKWFQDVHAPWTKLSTVEAMRLLLASLDDQKGALEPARMLGAAGVAAGYAHHVVRGLVPPVPDPRKAHADDVLRLLRGREGNPSEVRAFETYMVTVLDHGLNASTFAARVVASTAAGLPSSVVAALCALKGPLHGGAPGPVLDMLDDIERTGDATTWLEHAIQRGDRLMGFGHRVYRVRDPRADVLKRAVREANFRTGRMTLAAEVEAAALTSLKKFKGHKMLDTNVEFYTALLLESLDLPREVFTPVFALARTAGWVAHVLEQEATGRLIRPLSRYVGSIQSRPN